MRIDPLTDHAVSSPFEFARRHVSTPRTRGCGVVWMRCVLAVRCQSRGNLFEPLKWRHVPTLADSKLSFSVDVVGTWLASVWQPWLQLSTPTDRQAIASYAYPLRLIRFRWTRQKIIIKRPDRDIHPVRV